MKTRLAIIFILVFSSLLVSWSLIRTGWIIEKHSGYNLLFKSIDKDNSLEYNQLIENGLASVDAFFDSPLKQGFEIFIHPNRHSLDSTWQKDWNMPDFKSECWMVASGIASRFDMISPKRWDTESCEHIYSETRKTQQLITHELVHVYHGQHNSSPDFSNVEGIDWFVEGLATYASGQLDSIRISEIKKAVSENGIPDNLDDFWKGNLKYGLSGSLVMYIDKKYGRGKLITLLPLNNRSDLLSALDIKEAELLIEWENYILKM